MAILMPCGWLVHRGFGGIIDGAATQAATDFSYGAITLRVGGAAAGNALSASLLTFRRPAHYRGRHVGGTQV